ncbi:MAG: aminotransferase class III-fold pyridoxal phosphate-dependent enzyme, partial [Nannocystaceae bacterium]
MTHAHATLTEAQLRYIQRFADDYTRKTPTSLARRREAWPRLADPRSSSGYGSHAPAPMRELWTATKRIRYPLVGARCQGSRVWDIDDNEYIDFGLGFGVHLFGHRPDFLVEAMQRRIADGTPMGFQSDVANEVAEQIASMTSAERVAYSNTGTEAVMGAIRLARAATGRTKIVVFTHSYHGSYDATLPAIGYLHGMPPRVEEETLVLEYGAERSLEQIAEQAHEIAAVLIEPVQARQPHIQPQAFVAELRRITAAHGVALILDDVLLGFRIHQGGCQAHFDVKADLATFGKI